MNVIVTEGQSIIDIAIQEYGTALASFDLAVVNGLNLTDDLRPGQKLEIKESFYTLPEVQKYFKDRKQLIKSGIEITTPNPPNPTLDYVFAYQLPQLF